MHDAIVGALASGCSRAVLPVFPCADTPSQAHERPLAIASGCHLCILDVQHMLQEIPAMACNRAWCIETQMR